MFDLDNSKLVTLARLEGYDDVMDFLEVAASDSICPAICTSPGCDATADYEPDQDRGHCEACDTPTMQSALIIAGMI